MKKGILVLIVVALVLGLTSCSQDVYSKLGDIMGKMGNNVYGISANMAQVQAATESLSGSVSDDGSVDLDKAAGIISAVAGVKNSAQKTAALKEELAKPVTEDADTAAAVRTELKGKLSAVARDLDVAISAASGEQKQLLEDVQAALNALKDGISETPTMAELATVAVLNEMAKTASDVAEKDPSALLDEGGLTEEGMAIAESALGSLDTLKVVSEVANIDLLGDLNITALLGSLSRDVSRDSDDEAKFMAAVQVSVSKIFNLMTENGAFNENRYNSFIAQCKAIKSCYDLAAAPYTTGVAKLEALDDKLEALDDKLEALDAILSKNVDLRFTIEDLVSYVVVSAFAEVDKLASDAAKTFVSEFVTVNKDALENFGSSVEFKLPNTDALVNAVFGESFNPETAAKDLLAKLPSDALQILGTATVILVDAEYQSILNLANGNGKISGIFSKVAD